MQNSRRSWDHFARLSLPLRTSWLSPWRIVSYLISNLRGVRTQNKKETDAGLLGPVSFRGWGEGWNKEVLPAGGPGGGKQPSLDTFPVRAGGYGCQGGRSHVLPVKAGTSELCVCVAVMGRGALPLSSKIKISFAHLIPQAR